MRANDPIPYPNIVVPKIVIPKPPFPPTGPNNCFVPCGTNYDPVCSYNNKTFYNECELKCNGKTAETIKHRGPCPDRPKPIECAVISCSNDYNPVCSKSNKTYNNNC